MSTLKPLPGEMREAADWMARKELGRKATFAAVTEYVEKMTDSQIRVARGLHAAAASGSRV